MVGISMLPCANEEGHTWNTGGSLTMLTLDVRGIKPFDLELASATAMLHMDWDVCALREYSIAMGTPLKLDGHHIVTSKRLEQRKVLAIVVNA